MTEDRKTVKIADFGVARVSQSDSPITRVGTNMYAPPEHSPMFAGTTGTLTFTKLTPAADIYSLAKSAYVLITNESPRFFANQPITELPLALRRKPWANLLVEVLNQATRHDSRERQQTVNEFWQELSKIKLLGDTEDGAGSAEIRLRSPTVPQAQVARGYTPLAPQRPHFNTSQDLKLKNLSPAAARAPLVVPIAKANIVKLPNPPPPVITEPENAPVIEVYQPVPRQKNRLARQLAALLIFIFAFAGILYSTHNYLRGRGILPTFNSPLTTQQAVALMNINLRSEPNKNSDQIGLVTKDSRLKIIDSENGWYKISIVEQGSQPDVNSASGGWISGKSKDGDETIKLSR